MLDETIDRLRAEALSATDARGYFPAMYARVTSRVDAAITEGRFADGDRMAQFARTFADWYLGPLTGSRPLPGCWRAAFDVAGDSDLLIVQHLLLGINAHVNHDLPQVVVELAGDGPVDPLRSDFDAINDLLAETQSDVLRDLGRVAGWVHWATALGGGSVFNFSLERARDQAWSTAVRLHGRSDRAADVAELDRMVRVVAHLVTTPKTMVGWLLAVPRWLELDDPHEVVRRLLGELA